MFRPKLRAPETRIQRAIRIQPRDPRYHFAILVERRSINQNPAVGLQRDGADRGVRLRCGIKSRIQRSIRVEPPNSVADRSLQRVKRPTYDNLSVGLQRKADIVVTILSELDFNRPKIRIESARPRLQLRN